MTAAVVELDLYSGRPNPRWSLDDGEARALFDAVATLDAATAAVAVHERLGYRGIVVRPAGDGRPSLHVAAGCVHVADGRTLVDRDRLIERRLLDSGDGRVDAAVLDGVRATFGGMDRLA